MGFKMGGVYLGRNCSHLNWASDIEWEQKEMLPTFTSVPKNVTACPCPSAHAVKLISFMCNLGIGQTAASALTLGTREITGTLFFLRAESQFLIPSQT